MKVTSDEAAAACELLRRYSEITKEAAPWPRHALGAWMQKAAENEDWKACADILALSLEGRGDRVAALKLYERLRNEYCTV